MRYDLWMIIVALMLLAPGCHPDQQGDDDDSADPAWTDEDNDGFGVRDDCDDTDDTIWPGAPDECDGIDQDCDGIDGQDADADGFSTCQEDCDDTNADIYPLAEEVTNGEDDDCDGLIDEVTYPCDNPEAEPNDGPDEANTVALDDPVCGIIDTDGDADWFVFDVTAYTLIEFDIDASDDGSSLCPKIDVYSPDGVAQRTGTVGTTDPELSSFFGLAGTYYVAMADMVGTGSGMDHYYTLELVSSSPCTALEEENNDAYNYANLLSADDTTCGFIDNDTDKDWYRFQAADGETWTFDMDSFAVGSTLKGQLALYASDGSTQLALDDPTYPDDPIITFTFTADGWYYLRAESDFYGTYDNGGYLLTMYP